MRGSELLLLLVVIIGAVSIYALEDGQQETHLRHLQGLAEHPTQPEQPMSAMQPGKPMYSQPLQRRLQDQPEQPEFPPYSQQPEFPPYSQQPDQRFLAEVDDDVNTVENADDEQEFIRRRFGCVPGSWRWPRCCVGGVLWTSPPRCRFNPRTI